MTMTTLINFTHERSKPVGEETPAIKYDRALSLFTESVLKPDHDLRGCVIIKVVMNNSWK